MASERAALAACLLLAACGFDAEPAVHQRSVHTGETVRLEVEPDPGASTDAQVDWTLDAPDGSHASFAVPSPTMTSFTPDVPGTYLVDRWMEVGASDTWTDRFYVDVLAPAPIPRISGPTAASPGDHVSFSAATSDAPDGIELYSWRLVARPRDSAATLTATTTETVPLTPDLAGTYTLELAIFDGTLWSDTPDQHDLTVH